MSVSTALIVSKSAAMVAYLEVALEGQALTSTAFGDCASAADYLKTHTPRLILLDEGSEVPPMDFAWRIKRIKRLQPIPVFVLTSHLDERAQITSELSKVDRLIGKPIEGRQFRTYLQEALQAANGAYESTNGPQALPAKTTRID